MLTGTQIKSFAGKLVIIGLLSASGLTMTGCEDRTMPVPVENVPTFTPAPLVSEEPSEENTENVSIEDSAEQENQDEMTYPAPVVIPNTDVEEESE